MDDCRVTHRPEPTGSMIHLVRHGTAGRRSPDPDDIERPLDEAGVLQAKRIAELLDKQGIELIMASPALRCRQTVQFLAETAGLTVVISETLWEDRSPRETYALVQRLAQGGSSAVLCSHGNILAAVIDLLEASGTRVEGSGCAKGSVWTLAVDGGRIVGARYTKP